MDASAFRSIKGETSQAIIQLVLKAKDSWSIQTDERTYVQSHRDLLLGFFYLDPETKS